MTQSIKMNSTGDNCTVAFMVECTSLQKCKRSCQSIGSSGYRWFHDGCCECIGSNCINYGIKESKCLRCPYGPLTIPQVLEEEKAYDDFGQDYEEYECDHAVSICPLRQWINCLNITCLKMINSTSLINKIPVQLITINGGLQRQIIKVKFRPSNN